MYPFLICLDKNISDSVKMFHDEMLGDYLFDVANLISTLHRMHLPEVECNSHGFYMVDYTINGLNDLASTFTYPSIVSLFKNMLEEFEFRFDEKHPTQEFLEPSFKSPFTKDNVRDLLEDHFSLRAQIVTLPTRFYRNDLNKPYSNHPRKSPLSPVNTWRYWYKVTQINNAKLINFTKRSRPAFLGEDKPNDAPVPFWRR